MSPNPPPFRPNNPFEDDTPVDPTLDSMLREWIGDDTPPDLTSKVDEILLAAKNPQFGLTLLTDEELVAAVDRAWNETQRDAAQRSRSGSVRTASQEQDHQGIDNEPSWLPRGKDQYLRWVSLAVAASLMAILAILPWARSRKADKSIARPSQPMVFPKPGSGNDNLFPKTADSQIGQETVKSAPQNAGANPAVVVADPVVPAPRANPPSEPAMTGTTRGPSIASSDRNTTSSGTRAGAPQVAPVINSQLQHLWQRLRVEPGGFEARASLEDRLATVLIGRLPTDAEREWARKASAGGRAIDGAQALAQRWIEGDEFDRHWARALSDYYLDNSMPVEESESHQRFVAWLQQEIEQGTPLGLIERKILTSDAASDAPESHWIRRWVALANGQPSRLLVSDGPSLVGLSPEQIATLEMLALQGSRLSGQPLMSDWAAVESIERVFGTAAAFAAMLRPQDPQVFMSDAQGKVVLVPPTFPDGKPVVAQNGSQEGLGEWFENNVRAREGLVDFVWTRMIGQPLVPKVGLNEDEGLEDRKDLLEFLSQRAQSDLVGLKELVVWIAMASPLYRESIAIDAEKFLAMDDAKLKALQMQGRLFAKYDRKDRGPVNAASQLSSVALWLAPAPSPSVLLAQPAPTSGSIDPPAKSEPASGPQWSADRLAYELANHHPYERVRELAAGFANSTLDWKGIVDRAFLGCLSRYPNEQERRQAEELLSLCAGDRQLASSRLLNALLGHR